MKKVKLLVFELGDNPDANVVARYQADVIIQEIEDHPGYRVLKSKYGQDDLFQPGKIVETVDE